MKRETLIYAAIHYLHSCHILRRNLNQFGCTDDPEDVEDVEEVDDFKQ